MGSEALAWEALVLVDRLEAAMAERRFDASFVRIRGLRDRALARYRRRYEAARVFPR